MPVREPNVFPRPLVLDVSREKQNENMKRVVQERAEDYEEYIDRLLDNPPAPLVQLPRREQWERFRMLMIEAYGGDVVMAEMEARLLMREDYVDLLRSGVVPPPMSRPWVSMILQGQDETGMPVLKGAWLLMRKTLMRYRRLGKDFGGYSEAET